MSKSMEFILKIKLFIVASKVLITTSIILLCQPLFWAGLFSAPIVPFNPHVNKVRCYQLYSVTYVTKGETDPCVESKALWDFTFGKHNCFKGRNSTEDGS